MCIKFRVNGVYCDNCADLAQEIGAEAIVLHVGDYNEDMNLAAYIDGKFCLCPVDQRLTFPNKVWRKRRFDGGNLSVTRR